MKRIALLFVAACAISSTYAQITREQALQRLEANETQQVKSAQSASIKSSTRLFGAKDDLTTVLMIIPSGETVEVTGSDSTYYSVVYDGNSGYIFKRHAVLSQVNEVQKNIPEENPVRRDDNNITSSDDRESRFSYLEKKYGTSMAVRISAGKIWKGMTAQMVRDSWGEPQRINKSTENNQLREEWIYRNTWLYFENNFLTDWGPIKK